MLLLIVINLMQKMLIKGVVRNKIWLNQLLSCYWFSIYSRSCSIYSRSLKIACMVSHEPMCAKEMQGSEGSWSSLPIIIFVQMVSFLFTCSLKIVFICPIFPCPFQSEIGVKWSYLWPRHVWLKFSWLWYLSWLQGR